MFYKGSWLRMLGLPYKLLCQLSIFIAPLRKEFLRFTTKDFLSGLWNFKWFMNKRPINDFLCKELLNSFLGTFNLFMNFTNMNQYNALSGTLVVRLCNMRSERYH